MFRDVGERWTVMIDFQETFKIDTNHDILDLSKNQKIYNFDS